MKNYKKLLLCIIISILVFTFIGATLSVVKNRILVYKIVDSVNGNIEEISMHPATMYQATAGTDSFIYLASIEIGIMTGILIYLMFIKQAKIKKIIIISIICFIVLFLILNLANIISEIRYGTFDLSNILSNNGVLFMFSVVYIIIFIIICVANLIHKRRKDNNKEAN